MADENTTQTSNTPATSTDQAPLDGQSTVSNTQAAPAATPATPATQAKSVMMPSSALKKLKEAERDKGRKAALAAQDEEARKLGFANYEALKLAAAQAKNAPKPAAQGKPKDKPAATTSEPSETPANDRSSNRFQRENQQLLEDKRRLNKRKNMLEKQLAERDSLLQRESTLRQLSRIASRAGIHGDDENEMAVSLYEKHVSQLSDEQLETFDDEAFFAKTLRESKPYLFGVRDVPATTSAAAPQASTSAASTASTPTATNTTTSPKKNVMDMNRKEYAEYLASRGLTNPADAT